MSESKIAVGCAGAGVLGSAIIRRLLECDFSVTVWNRDQEKLRSLIASGAVPVATPAAPAKSSDFVLTCVTAGAAVEGRAWPEAARKAR